MEQRDIGRLEVPFGLTASGRLVNDHSAPINVAFRLPVIHPGKVGARDDRRHSVLNDFRVIATPKSRPSRDHVAECVR